MAWVTWVVIVLVILCIVGGIEQTIIEWWRQRKR